MTDMLLLAGCGLLLLPAADRRVARLRWLAASRLGRAEPAGTGGQRHRGWLAALSWRARGAGVAAVSSLLAWPLAGALPAGLAALTGGVLVGCWHSVAGERALDRDGAALLAAVSALTEEYAGGATVGAAFGASAPAAGRFGPALAAAGVLAGFGAEPAAALATEPALAPLGVGCALAGRTGASLARVLAGVRADLAADKASRRAVRAAVAGSRTSALLLAGLPVVGLLMGAALGVDPGRVLLRTAVGLAALTAGVLLNLAGLMWTLRLTRSRLEPA